MKKKISVLLMLLIASVVSLTSCSKDDSVSPTTYTFLYSIADDPDMSVSMTILEYNSKGEQIANNNVKCMSGLSKTFTANSNTEKVKLYLTVTVNSKSASRWVQQVYYLKKNDNTTIEFTGKTMVGIIEP
jgi:hypothetical protein